MLDKSLRKPLYQQVVDYIMERIDSGEYQPGQLIPSESMFCEELGVSRVTVRNAIQKLVDDGTILRYHGKGSFVNDRLNKSTSTNFRGFTAMCKEHNIVVYSHVLRLETIAATPELVRELQLEIGEPVVYLERVRFANYKAVILERTYFSYKKYAFLLDENFENISLYRIIEKHTGLNPEESCSNTFVLEGSVASAEEAKHLNVEPGSSLFVLKETVVEPDGTPVHFTKQLMLSKMFQFMLSTPENRLNIKLDD